VWCSPESLRNGVSDSYRLSAEAVNLRRDSPLKASRSDAFSHSVTACPRGRVIGDGFGDRSAVPEPDSSPY